MDQIRRLTQIMTLTAALTLGLVACEDPKYTPEQATPFVAQWAESVGDELKEQSASAATSEALKAALSAKADAERQAPAKVSAPPFYALAEQLYAERQFKAGFIKKGKLTESAQAVLAQLERVADDGFDAKLYHAQEIKSRVEELKALREQYQSLGDFKPGDPERAHLVAYITSKKPQELELKPELKATLTEELLKAPAGEPLRQTIAKYGELSAKMASAEADIELMLSVGMLRYAHAMRYHRMPQSFIHERHDDRYNDPETKGRRPLEAQATYTGGVTWRHAAFVAKDIAKAHGVPLLRAAMINTLKQAMSGEHEQALAKLIPSPQYVALRKEYVRYKKIASEGGWDELKEQRSLKEGARSEEVKKLKLRLQKEGLLASNALIDDRFDRTLTEAIKAYQATHQLDEDGKVGRGFYRSLNVSAEDRASQVLLNMKRWRSSDVQHHDHPLYVLVNIPDFNVEIWKQQQRELRMRIVVGNNDEAEDEESKKKVHPNRTPTLSAYIDRVIYNPFWNVTSRIREDEILVDVRKDLEPRYVAKLQKLIGAPAPAVPAGPASANGVVIGAQDPNAAAPAAANGVAARFTRKSPDGLVFDVEGIKAAYYEKHQADLDLKAQLPYLDPNSGLINVSVTDPNNIPPWYAANGYEVMHPGKSWEFVRQLNGKENSLGQVKIIFPNLHDVYLHDTNAKALFSKTLRAYSHGCMRMHKPLDFAQWLLENDGSWEDRQIKKVLSDVTYEPIFLKTKVPVHIVYHTVVADDKGRANFLLDVYSYDREGKLHP